MSETLSHAWFVRISQLNSYQVTFKRHSKCGYKKSVMANTLTFVAGEFIRIT